MHPDFSGTSLLPSSPFTLKTGGSTDGSWSRAQGNPSYLTLELACSVMESLDAVVCAGLAQWKVLGLPRALCCTLSTLCCLIQPSLGVQRKRELEDKHPWVSRNPTAQPRESRGAGWDASVGSGRARFTSRLCCQPSRRPDQSGQNGKGIFGCKKMQPQSRAFKDSDTLLPVQFAKKIAYSDLAKSQ